MRPMPGTTDRLSAGDLDDALSATPTQPLSCFITTEAALKAADCDSMPTHFRPTFPRRKRSVESNARSARSQLPSPTPTGDSSASLSSLALDSELDHDAFRDESSRNSPQVATTSLDTPSATSSSPSRRRSLAASPHRRGLSGALSPSGQSSSGHAPQLIMPSLSVPQRRPFSETGKSLGKLKLLIAGPAGIGKMSLTNAIAHSCDHIVHMDPVSSISDGFCELWASTRSLPWWKGDVGSEVDMRRRRPSTGEILDRNLCFVIASAYGSSGSKLIAENYVDHCLSPLLHKSVEDSDLLKMISNGTEPVVDAVLYMIPHTGLEVRDIQIIRSLQDKTNVIPLLARSDEVESGSITLAKDQIRQQLHDSGLECFSFGTLDSISDFPYIYSVSSATLTDYEVMDASALMSSNYMQPLVPTDLPALIRDIFSSDGSAWLRHSAASKCVQWRRDQGGSNLQMTLTQRNSLRDHSSTILNSYALAPRSYWARIEVTNWAQGLRNSLETEQLCHIAHNQMAAQLIQQWRSRDLVCKLENATPLQGDSVSFVHQDPLGLLHAGSRLKRKGQLTFELLSSIGIVGCFAAWLAGPEWASSHGLRQLSRDIIGWTLMI